MHALADLDLAPVAYSLTSRVCIGITGADAGSWLNGVVSCDVLAVLKKSGVHAVYGCALNVKGKILADVIVVADAADAVDAYVPTATSEALLTLWNGYVVMEDVGIVAYPSRSLVLVQGANAGRVAGTIAGAIVADFDDLGRGGVAIETSDVTTTLDALEHAGATIIDEATARSLRIEAGRATYGVDIDATSYVQEGGLETRAVSFNKGCYLGQEIVCTLQMRGKVHRKLAQLEGLVAMAAGAEVTVDGAVVGKITSSIMRGDGHAFALAMIKSSAITEGRGVRVGLSAATIVGEAH